MLIGKCANIGSVHHSAVQEGSWEFGVREGLFRDKRVFHLFFQVVGGVLQAKWKLPLFIIRGWRGHFRGKRDLPSVFLRQEGGVLETKGICSPHYFRLTGGGVRFRRKKRTLPSTLFEIRRGFQRQKRSPPELFEEVGVLESKGTSPAAEHHTGTKKGILVWLNAPPPLQIQCGVECPTL